MTQQHTEAREHVLNSVKLMTGMIDIMEGIVEDPAELDISKELVDAIKALKVNSSAIELFKVLNLMIRADDSPLDQLTEVLYGAVQAQMEVEELTYGALLDQVYWTNERVEVFNVIKVGDEVHERLRDPFGDDSFNHHSWMVVQLTQEGKLPMNTPIQLEIVRRESGAPDEVLDTQIVAYSRVGYGVQLAGTGHCTDIGSLLSAMNELDAYISEIQVGEKVWKFNEGVVYMAYFSELNNAIRENLGADVKIFCDRFDGGVQEHKAIMVPIEIEGSTTVQ